MEREDYHNENIPGIFTTAAPVPHCGEGGALERENIASRNYIQKKFPDTRMCSHSGLKKEMKQIREQNEKIFAAQQETIKSIKKLKLELISSKFPLASDSDLLRMEEEINMAENKNEYVKCVQEKILPDGIKKNLHRLFSEELILQYNYTGVKGKREFGKFKNINNIIFCGLKTENYRRIDYEEDMKSAFKLIKNKIKTTQEKVVTDDEE